VPEVQLVICLGACDCHLLSVDDNHICTHVHGGGVGRQVLAPGEAAAEQSTAGHSLVSADTELCWGCPDCRGDSSCALQKVCHNLPVLLLLLLRLLLATRTTAAHFLAATRCFSSCCFWTSSPGNLPLLCVC
jgi:hypothetical protein